MVWELVVKYLLACKKSIPCHTKKAVTPFARSEREKWIVRTREKKGTRPRDLFRTVSFTTTNKIKARVMCVEC